MNTFPLTNEQQKIEEVWKEVPGFEHYQVSSLGRLRKTVYMNVSLKTEYPQIGLYKEPTGTMKRGSRKNKQYKRFLHRLMAEAFIPNPLNLPMVNHKDGNKKNFSLDNLEWCTPRENCLHAYRTGLNKGGQSQQNMVVVQVGQDMQIIKIWKGCREIRAAGNTWNKVYDSINRGIWYKKCKWYYSKFKFDYRNNQYFSGPAKDKSYQSFERVTSQIFSEHRGLIPSLLITPPARNKKKIKDHNGHVYDSILEAASITDCDRTDISRALKSGNSVKGFFFKVATESEYTAYINSKK